MPEILPDRMTARIEGDFVVFLIGMRINAFWKPHKWVPPALAMMRMQRELARMPVGESGLLGTMLTTPRLTVQYWRSFDHLEAYAQRAEAQHLPAWRAFNRAARSNRGDVGIWHETFLVRDGAYESLYSGMPAFGMGKVGQLMPATGPMSKARTRVGRAGDEGVSDAG